MQVYRCGRVQTTRRQRHTQAKRTGVDTDTPAARRQPGGLSIESTTMKNILGNHALALSLAALATGLAALPAQAVQVAFSGSAQDSTAAYTGTDILGNTWITKPGFRSRASPSITVSAPLRPLIRSACRKVGSTSCVCAPTNAWKKSMPWATHKAILYWRRGGTVGIKGSGQ